MTTKQSITNRTAIMQAVAEIITNEDYGSVSMSQVAKLTGLSVATAYNYFENKQDMILTAYQEACEKINEFILSQVGEKGTPDAKLASYMRAIYTFSQQEPTTFLFTNSIFNSPVARKISEKENWRDSIMNPWTKIAKDGISDGYFRTMDPLSLIYMAYDCVSGFIVNSFFKNINPNNTSIDEIIIIFLTGIKSPLTH